MRVASALRTLVAALGVALYASNDRVDAAASVAGAPERLVAKGGECVRLFHSKGDNGCRSITNSDMAALYPIENENDLKTWLADTSDDSKRVLVLPEHLITADVLDKAKDRLAGIFAFPDGIHNVTFASQTPQGEGSADSKLNPFTSKKIKWNPEGLGLTDIAVNYPIMLLRDAKLGGTFMDRAKMNLKSNSGATYRAFMKYYYGPESMNSITCLQFKNIYGNRHPKCDPIGGQSAWGVRGNRSANETVIVMAGMDAYALSQVLVPGANEAASGVTALLAAAKALQAIPDSEFSKQIVFATFQAEKFGFVGSRRFLSDLKASAKKDFCKTPVSGSKSPFSADFCSSPVYPSLEFAKLKPSSFAYAIAVDQVGLLSKAGNFSIHVNPNAPAQESSALVKIISGVPSAKSKFGKGSVSALPPTPLTSFVNDGEFGQKDLVSAVIAGYDSAFLGTGAYGSHHDIVELLDVDAVSQAAQVLAESIYTLAAKSASSTSLGKIKVDKTLVQDMLTCISQNWTCDLMKNYSTPWVKTMVKYLDLLENSWPQFKLPVSLYSGPLNSDRQPLVLKGANSDKFSYVTDYSDSWSDDSNRMTLFPNAYEVFTRSFLATVLADSTATTDKTCAKTQDCEGSGMECVYPGVCAKLRSYFHDAYSPGINRTAAVQVYDILDESMPLWTEPSWDSDVGSYVFPDPGETIGWVALAVGVVISGVGVVLSRMVLGSVHKMKLL